MRDTTTGSPTPILAAEVRQEDATRLQESLAILGLLVRLATSAEEVMDHLRRELFRRAVVAVELRLAGKPMLGRISRLPAIEHLVAIGPSGAATTEAYARAAGARTYVTRPVTPAALAVALRTDIGGEALWDGIGIFSKDLGFRTLYGP